MCVTEMDQEYSTVKKGTGVLYVCANLLYRRVKTAGNVNYLKCYYIWLRRVGEACWRSVFPRGK